MHSATSTWLLFALFAYPALAIPAAYRHGCRERHFVAVQVIGSFCAVLFWAPLVAYSESHGFIAGAASYLLATTAAIMLAAVLNADRADDDEAPPEEPDGVDWESFERRFWDHVERSRRRYPAPV